MIIFMDPPRQTRYRYRLEGFDPDWIEVAGTQRLVTDTNLAPTRYVFRVSAADAHGDWNATGRAITTTVKFSNESTAVGPAL